MGLAAVVAAAPASADITDDCPATIPPSTTIDNAVGASYAISGNTASYSFSSFVNEHPSGGIPGLIEYCVFTGALPDTSTVDRNLAGADGELWGNSGDKSSYFGFLRPHGDPSNIPLDGTTGTTMGTATWNSGTPPTDQIIVLHINDPSECNALYQDGSLTCFVLPGTPPPPPQNQDLTVSKTANPSFTKTYTWSITKDVDQTKVKIAPGGTATFNYTVSVTHDTGDEGDWQVAGKITVTNANSSDFTGVNVTDSSGGGGTCSVTDANAGVGETIPANSSVEFPYTCAYTSNPGSVNDTATASWDSSAENTPDGSASDTANADFSSAQPTNVDDCVSVTDTFGGALGTPCVGDQNPAVFTYSKTFTGGDTSNPAGTCTEHDNTAIFTTNTTGATGSASQAVDVCVGADLQVSKTANPTFTRTFTWDIKKQVDNSEIDIAAGGSATANYTVTVSHDSGTDSAWQVDGKITVTNPNDWEDITANVADVINDGGDCTVTGGTSVLVPAGKSVDLPYTCTYDSAPDPLTGGQNTATATWDKAASYTHGDSATGTADVDFSTPTKIVDGTVIVNDTLAGTLGTVSFTDKNPTIFSYPITFSPAKSGTCTHYPNTATFTTDTTGATSSASQDVKVCVGADLTVSKTATPSFTRKYNWQINKSVDKTTLDPGGTANYTVTVTETGFTDSGWQVTGTITVYNPNDWESVSANVTDAIDNGGTCTVGGSGVTLMPLSSMQLPYTCTYSNAPSPSVGSNTATASWDKAAFHTPKDSATGNATADFGSTTPTPVHKTVTVTDSQGGNLGSVIATDTTPYATQMFTYSKKFSPPASGCTMVNNTATIVETSQTASAAVMDCNSGALTMGFWQNKNGQAIITGGASTGGVCNSGTWLRNYFPFQDLSATATCAQVASYVTNVIKAANASGSSMNAMLKAQMLATSLDVYFSDKALGGNKIGAQLPIGGLTIDLAHVCHMIDSSSGGTCSGTFENVSSAFGGASSLTVAQMLAFAAGKSNVGGTTWYGNVKATQQLAKDAFDAINNQVAISP